jgi:hypothetical protein
MKYGVCVVDPLGDHGVIECWCGSHDEAAAEVAKRGGAAIEVVKYLTGPARLE